jgi:hypothetical protein
MKTCFRKFWSNAKGDPPLPPGTLGLAKGGPQEILQKLPPQTSPNFLKILENLFSHQKHYFRSIKTCFKKIWANATLLQTSPNSLKIVETISSHQENYFQSINKNMFKIFFGQMQRGP